MASRSEPLSLATVRRRYEKRQQRRLWIKRVVCAVGGVAIAWAIFPMARKIGRPYRQSQVLEVRLAKLRLEHDSLTERVQERARYHDYLSTAEAREARARHDGYHLPGEQVYLLSDNTP